MSLQMCPNLNPFPSLKSLGNTLSYADPSVPPLSLPPPLPPPPRPSSSTTSYPFCLTSFSHLRVHSSSARRCPTPIWLCLILRLGFREQFRTSNSQKSSKLSSSKLRPTPKSPPILRIDPKPISKRGKGRGPEWKYGVGGRRSIKSSLENLPT